MAEESRRVAERQTLWILVTISAWMTFWILWRFLSDPDTYIERRLGINEDLTGVASWIWIPTIAIVAVYVGYTLWAIPGVRRYVLRPNLLGLVAIWAAVVSGIIEEVLFRHLLMDWLDERGSSALAQVLISAGLFGAAHALWAFMARDWKVIIPVVTSTAVLGLLLAMLYLAADRSTLPAIIAHTLTNLIIEPGLIATACLTGLRARDGWPESTSDAKPEQSSS